MIVNFRATKWIMARVLFAVSVILNIYAVICIQSAETSLEGCENYIKQLEVAQAYYTANFGEK